MALVLAGCSSPPEVKYYSLRGEKPIEVKLDERAPAVLLDRFAADDSCADDRLAYRQGPHELGFDPYSRWAGPPASQVEDAVRDLLTESGLFSAVRQAQPIGTGRSGYDLIVTGRLARFEEIDGDDAWQAALDLELFLLDGKTRAVLASSRFARVAPSEKRNPRDVAAALAKLLDQAVAEFVQAARPQVALRRGSAR
jgi:ABC-type uncharacterized transport system auxiliary subunit